MVSASSFFSSRLLDELLLLVDDGLDLRANVVNQLADNRALLCGDVFHALEQSSQLALFAEELDTRIVKCTSVTLPQQAVPSRTAKYLAAFLSYQFSLERDVHAGTEIKKPSVPLHFLQI